jgi:nucleoid-associated protein
MADLTITHVVVHALVKEQHKGIQNSIISPEVLDVKHEAVGKMVSGVVDVYGTRNNSAQYGIFQEGEGRGRFPDKLLNYYEIEQPSDEQFLDLTKVAMSRLYDKASDNHASSGGYLLFADYSNLQGRYLLIAMIKQKPDIVLTKNLKPEELMALDLNKLNQAARISFGKLSAYLAAQEDARQDLNYLSFVNPSSTKTASGYFVKALGCSEGPAAAQTTRMLVKESKNFFKTRDDLRPQQESFIRALFEYLQRKAENKESVKLSEIENLVRRHIPEHLADKADGIAGELITHLNSEECRVPAEFSVNQATLKRLTHITGGPSSWKMTFDRKSLGTDEAAAVYYNKEEQKLILRNIPEKMRELIDEELTSRIRQE